MHGRKVLQRSYKSYIASSEPLDSVIVEFDSDDTDDEPERAVEAGGTGTASVSEQAALLQARIAQLSREMAAMTKGRNDPLTSAAPSAARPVSQGADRTGPVTRGAGKAGAAGDGPRPARAPTSIAAAAAHAGMYGSLLAAGLSNTASKPSTTSAKSAPTAAPKKRAAPSASAPSQPALSTAKRTRPNSTAAATAAVGPHLANAATARPTNSAAAMGTSTSATAGAAIQPATVDQRTAATQQAVASQQASANQQAFVNQQALANQQASMNQQALANQQASMNQQALANQQASMNQQALANQQASMNQQATAHPLASAAQATGAAQNTSSAISRLVVATVASAKRVAAGGVGDAAAGLTGTATGRGFRSDITGHPIASAESAGKVGQSAGNALRSSENAATSASNIAEFAGNVAKASGNAATQSRGSQPSRLATVIDVLQDAPECLTTTDRVGTDVANGYAAQLATPHTQVALATDGARPSNTHTPDATSAYAHAPATHASAPVTHANAPATHANTLAAHPNAPDASRPHSNGPPAAATVHGAWSNVQYPSTAVPTPTNSGGGATQENQTTKALQFVAKKAGTVVTQEKAMQYFQAKQRQKQQRQLQLQKQQRQQQLVQGASIPEQPTSQAQDTTELPQQQQQRGPIAGLVAHGQTDSPPMLTQATRQHSAGSDHHMPAPQHPPQAAPSSLQQPVVASVQHGTQSVHRTPHQYAQAVPTTSQHYTQGEQTASQPWATAAPMQGQLAASYEQGIAHQYPYAQHYGMAGGAQVASGVQATGGTQVMSGAQAAQVVGGMQGEPSRQGGVVAHYGGTAVSVTDGAYADPAMQDSREVFKQLLRVSAPSELPTTSQPALSKQLQKMKLQVRRRILEKAIDSWNKEWESVVADEPNKDAVPLLQLPRFMHPAPVTPTLMQLAPLVTSFKQQRLQQLLALQRHYSTPGAPPVAAPASLLQFPLQPPPYWPGQVTPAGLLPTWPGQSPPLGQQPPLGPVPSPGQASHAGSLPPPVQLPPGLPVGITVPAGQVPGSIPAPLHGMPPFPLDGQAAVPPSAQMPVPSNPQMALQSSTPIVAPPSAHTAVPPSVRAVVLPDSQTTVPLNAQMAGPPDKQAAVQPSAQTAAPSDAVPSNAQATRPQSSEPAQLQPPKTHIVAPLLRSSATPGGSIAPQVTAAPAASPARKTILEQAPRESTVAPVSGVVTSYAPGATAVPKAVAAPSVNGTSSPVPEPKSAPLIPQNGQVLRTRPHASPVGVPGLENGQREVWTSAACMTTLHEVSAAKDVHASSNAIAMNNDNVVNDLGAIHPSEPDLMDATGDRAVPKPFRGTCADTCAVNTMSNSAGTSPAVADAAPTSTRLQNMADMTPIADTAGLNPLVVEASTDPTVSQASTDQIDAHGMVTERSESMVTEGALTATIVGASSLNATLNGGSPNPSSPRCTFSGTNLIAAVVDTAQQHDAAQQVGTSCEIAHEPAALQAAVQAALQAGLAAGLEAATQGPAAGNDNADDSPSRPQLERQNSLQSGLQTALQSKVSCEDGDGPQVINPAGTVTVSPSAKARRARSLAERLEQQQATTFLPHNGTNLSSTAVLHAGTDVGRSTGPQDASGGISGDGTRGATQIASRDEGRSIARRQTDKGGDNGAMPPWLAAAHQRLQERGIARRQTEEGGDDGALPPWLAAAHQRLQERGLLPGSSTSAGQAAGSGSSAELARRRSSPGGELAGPEPGSRAEPVQPGPGAELEVCQNSGAALAGSRRGTRSARNQHAVPATAAQGGHAAEALNPDTNAAASGVDAPGLDGATRVGADAAKSGADSPGANAHTPGLVADSPGADADAPGSDAESPRCDVDSPSSVARGLNADADASQRGADAEMGSDLDLSGPASDVEMEESDAAVADRGSDSGAEKAGSDDELAEARDDREADVSGSDAELAEKASDADVGVGGSDAEGQVAGSDADAAASGSGNEAQRSDSDLDLATSDADLEGSGSDAEPAEPQSDMEADSEDVSGDAELAGGLSGEDESAELESDDERAAPVRDTNLAEGGPDAELAEQQSDADLDGGGSDADLAEHGSDADPDEGGSDADLAEHGSDANPDDGGSDADLAEHGSDADLDDGGSDADLAEHGSDVDMDERGSEGASAEQGLDSDVAEAGSRGAPAVPGTQIVTSQQTGTGPAPNTAWLSQMQDIAKAAMLRKLAGRSQAGPVHRVTRKGSEQDQEEAPAEEVQAHVAAGRPNVAAGQPESAGQPRLVDGQPESTDTQTGIEERRPEFIGQPELRGQCRLMEERPEVVGGQLITEEWPKLVEMLQHTSAEQEVAERGQISWVPQRGVGEFAPEVAASVRSAEIGSQPESQGVTALPSSLPDPAARNTLQDPTPGPARQDLSTSAHLSDPTVVHIVPSSVHSTVVPTLPMASPLLPPPNVSTLEFSSSKPLPPPLPVLASSNLADAGSLIPATPANTLSAVTAGTLAAAIPSTPSAAAAVTAAAAATVAPAAAAATTPAAAAVAASQAAAAATPTPTPASTSVIPSAAAAAAITPAACTPIPIQYSTPHQGRQPRRQTLSGGRTASGQVQEPIDLTGSDADIDLVTDSEDEAMPDGVTPALLAVAARSTQSGRIAHESEHGSLTGDVLEVKTHVGAQPPPLQQPPLSSQRPLPSGTQQPNSLQPQSTPLQLQQTALRVQPPFPQASACQPPSHPVPHPPGLHGLSETYTLTALQHALAVSPPVAGLWASTGSRPILDTTPAAAPLTLAGPSPGMGSGSAPSATVAAQSPPGGDVVMQRVVQALSTHTPGRKAPKPATHGPGTAPGRVPGRDTGTMHGGMYESPLLLFRTYRLTSAFAATAILPPIAPMVCHTINPHWPMDHHEVRGHCNDPHCQHQRRIDYECTSPQDQASELAVQLERSGVDLARELKLAPGVRPPISGVLTLLQKVQNTAGSVITPSFTASPLSCYADTSLTSTAKSPDPKSNGPNLQEAKSSTWHTALSDSFFALPFRKRRRLDDARMHSVCFEGRVPTYNPPNWEGLPKRPPPMYHSQLLAAAPRYTESGASLLFNWGFVDVGLGAAVAKATARKVLADKQHGRYFNSQQARQETASTSAKHAKVGAQTVNSGTQQPGAIANAGQDGRSPSTPASPSRLTDQSKADQADAEWESKVVTQPGNEQHWLSWALQRAFSSPNHSGPVAGHQVPTQSGLQKAVAVLDRGLRQSLPNSVPLLLLRDLLAGGVSAPVGYKVRPDSYQVWLAAVAAEPSWQFRVRLLLQAVVQVAAVFCDEDGHGRAGAGTAQQAAVPMDQEEDQYMPVSMDLDGHQSKESGRFTSATGGHVSQRDASQGGTHLGSSGEGGLQVFQDTAACVLDLALRLLQLWCQVGKASEAAQFIMLLDLTSNSSPEQVASSCTASSSSALQRLQDAAVAQEEELRTACCWALLKALRPHPMLRYTMWASCAHLLAYRHLPDGVTHVMSYRSHVPLVLSWEQPPSDGAVAIPIAASNRGTNRSTEAGNAVAPCAPIRNAASQAAPRLQNADAVPSSLAGIDAAAKILVTAAGGSFGGLNLTATGPVDPPKAALLLTLVNLSVNQPKTCQAGMKSVFDKLPHKLPGMQETRELQSKSGVPGVPASQAVAAGIPAAAATDGTDAYSLPAAFAAGAAHAVRSTYPKSGQGLPLECEPAKLARFCVTASLSLASVPSATGNPSAAAAAALVASQARTGAGPMASAGDARTIPAVANVGMPAAPRTAGTSAAANSVGAITVGNGTGTSAAGGGNAVAVNTPAIGSACGNGDGAAGASEVAAATEDEALSVLPAAVSLAVAAADWSVWLHAGMDACGILSAWEPVTVTKTPLPASTDWAAIADRTLHSLENSVLGQSPAMSLFTSSILESSAQACQPAVWHHVFLSSMAACALHAGGPAACLDVLLAGTACTLKGRPTLQHRSTIRSNADVTAPVTVVPGSVDGRPLSSTALDRCSLSQLMDARESFLHDLQVLGVQVQWKPLAEGEGARAGTFANGAALHASNQNTTAPLGPTANIPSITTLEIDLSKIEISRSKSVAGRKPGGQNDGLKSESNNEAFRSESSRNAAARTTANGNEPVNRGANINGWFRSQANRNKSLENDLRRGLEPTRAWWSCGIMCCLTNWACLELFFGCLAEGWHLFHVALGVNDVFPAAVRLMGLQKYALLLAWCLSLLRSKLQVEADHGQADTHGGHEQGRSAYKSTLQQLLKAVQSVLEVCQELYPLQPLSAPCMDSLEAQTLELLSQPASTDYSVACELLCGVSKLLSDKEVVSVAEMVFDLTPRSPAMAPFYLLLAQRHPSSLSWLAWLLPLLASSLPASFPPASPSIWRAAVQLAKGVSASAAFELSKAGTQAHPHDVELWRLHRDMAKVTGLKPVSKVEQAMAARGLPLA